MELKDILNSINYNKSPLLDNEEKVDKIYPAFVVNKCLSYFNDTILFANEINCHWEMDKKMQFDFYRFALRKKKRFSPWIRKEKDENIALIKEIYGYTDAKAYEVLNILGPDGLEVLKQSIQKGGINNKE